MTITERVEDQPGRVMPVDNDATVFAELPATTYRYTSTPWMNKNSNTMKNGRNPETHDVIDELKPVDPLVIDLDGSAYREIP